MFVPAFRIYCENFYGFIMITFMLFMYVNQCYFGLTLTKTVTTDEK